MANFCWNDLWIIAKEPNMRGILLRMVENLSVFEDEEEWFQSQSAGPDAPLDSIAESLRVSLNRDPIYLYALADEPEHRHMSETATFRCERYAEDWWYLWFRFTTDWGPASAELGEFYASLEGLEFGWLDAFKSEGSGVVVPDAKASIDSRFGGYGSIGSRFYASYYHRATGLVPPPDKQYLASLVKCCDFSVLEQVAERYPEQVSEFANEANLSDLYKKGQYEAFSFLISHRTDEYRPSRSAEMLVDAVRRGDDMCIDALARYLTWSKTTLSKAEGVIGDELTGEFAQRAARAIAEAWTATEVREVRKKEMAKAWAKKIRAEERARKEAEKERLKELRKELFDPSIDYSGWLDRDYWDRKEPLISVRIKKQVGEKAFSGCKTLKSVDIFGACDSIGVEAFRGCVSLVSVEMRDRKRGRDLCSRAFKGCTSLESAAYGSVGALGTKVFDGCTSLRFLTLTASHSSDILASAFGNLPRLERVTLKGQWAVGRDAFNGCMALKELVVTTEASCRSEYAFIELPAECVVRCDGESQLTKRARECGLRVVIG